MTDYHVGQHLDEMDELIAEDRREQQERHEEAQIIESIPERHTEDDMSEHTAAPWQIEDQHYNGRKAILPVTRGLPGGMRDDFYASIADVLIDDRLGTSYEEAREEAEANAHLIAAAPELADLLIQAWRILRFKDTITNELKLADEIEAKLNEAGITIDEDGGPTDD